MQEKKRGRTHSRWLLPAALVLAGAAWFENFTLSTSTVTAACAALPEAFSGLRIVQISDLHGRRFDAESRYLLELVRLQSPDLIALTGDLADEYRLLKKGQASIVLAGVDDPNGPYDQKRPAQLVREIRQSWGRAAYILMLSHRNDELDLWANMGVQTVLCGHGHGGIVRLPFVGAVFGTHLDLFPDYTAGLYRKGQTSMIVSRGLGGSRKLPLRIGNRPEIVTVILKAESGKV